MATQGKGPIRAVIFLGLALLAGILAMFVLMVTVDNFENQIVEARAPEDQTTVIVAARDLYQGVTITEQDLYAVEIPPRFLPEGVFLSPEHVVGRIPRERILANEFVRSSRLADPESGVGLNAVIPRGMRAISLPLANGQALSGFLNPLNYVDILVTVGAPESLGGGYGGGTSGMSRSGEEGMVETRTLLQAVFVLGVNSRMHRETWQEARDKRGNQDPSVTLLVTADQAEMLAHAQKMGQIRLTLRNDLDVNYQQLAGVDIEALRRKIKKARPKKSTGVPRVVPASSVPKTGALKVIRGQDIEIKTISQDGQVISSGR
jgi:pilus assembly protein CpaB